LRNIPELNHHLLWPTREQWPGLQGLAQLFTRLRRGRFDLSVEFSNYNGWLSSLAGTSQRVEMRLPRFWWIKPRAGHEWRKYHAVEHYSDVVRQLGIEVEDCRLRIFPTQEERAKANAWLERHGVEPEELLVAIHPGGEGLWGRKRWGVDGFARVADGLSEQLGARIVIMGGKDDASLAAELAWRTNAHIINATGQTTLGETAALAARCTLFIGSDSSPLHIASAMGTRVVGIYGPVKGLTTRLCAPHSLVRTSSL
jgi:ADP-heptose:LPS heptosyltransferase